MNPSLAASAILSTNREGNMAVAGVLNLHSLIGSGVTTSALHPCLGATLKAVLAKSLQRNVPLANTNDCEDLPKPSFTLTTGCVWASGRAIAFWCMQRDVATRFEESRKCR